MKKPERPEDFARDLSAQLAKSLDEQIRKMSTRLDTLRAAKQGKVQLRSIPVKSYDVPAYSVARHTRWIVDKRKPGAR